MTKRDKATIFSVVLLAVLVIVSTLIASIRSGAEGMLDTVSLILYCCVAAAGVFSVIIVFVVKIRKRKYEKQLIAEYYQDYEVIRDTINNSQLGMAAKNEIRNDVLDILISAQKSGKPAEDAVGDPEEFAKEILCSYSKPGYMAVLELIDAVVAFAVIILGASVFQWIEQTNSSFFSIEIGADMLFFFIVIASLVIPVTRHMVSTRSNWAYFIPIAFGIVFILLSMLLQEWFYDVEWVGNFLNGTVRMIPNPYILSAYVLSVILLLFTKYQLRKHMLKRKRE